MINTLSVEQGGTALDAMHLITLTNQEFGEITAILTRDTCDEGLTHEKTRGAADQFAAPDTLRGGSSVSPPFSGVLKTT